MSTLDNTDTPWACPRCGRSDGTPVLMQWFESETGPHDEEGCMICYEEAKNA